MKYSDFIANIIKPEAVYCNRINYIICDEYMNMDEQVLIKCESNIPKLKQLEEQLDNTMLVEYYSIIGALENIPECSFLIPFIPYRLSILSLILVHSNIMFVIQHAKEGDVILKQCDESYAISIDKPFDFVYITQIELSDAALKNIELLKQEIIKGDIII